MYVPFITVRFWIVSLKLCVLDMYVYVSFMLEGSVSLGMGESGGHSKGSLLGLWVRSGGMLSMDESSVVDVMDSCVGVSDMGGAGSAQRSLEVVLSADVSDRSSVDGVGVGWGAGSAHSSLELVLVVSASQLLLVVGLRGVFPPLIALGENSGAEDDSVGDVGVVVGLAAVMVVSEVVDADASR